MTQPLSDAEWEDAHERLARIEERPENREGIVTVYDDRNRYLGCMGIERWRWLLDGGPEAAEQRLAQVEKARDKLEGRATIMQDTLHIWIARAEAAEQRNVVLREALAEALSALESATDTHGWTPKRDAAEQKARQAVSQTEEPE